MIKKILIVLIVIIAAFAVIASMQPAEFRVSRSLNISAPADVIFSNVNNLHQWKAWSPWASLDPNAKESFEGPDAGVGAIMKWAGNYKVGEGSMTITESQPNEVIKFKLDFLKPMQATNTSEFALTPESQSTSVTWTMHGTNNFIGKAMSLIFNCEKMIGSQFEKGLANLKVIAETEATK